VTRILPHNPDWDANMIGRSAGRRHPRAITSSNWKKYVFMPKGTDLAVFVFALLAACVPATLALAAGNEANGSLAYKGRTVALKYAWLVKGPYERDPTKTVRHLFLSLKDIGAEIQACKTISCADGKVTEGMTVDFDVRPRLDYWIALNGQKVQHSGGAMPNAFTSRANAPGHLAGKLAIDDAPGGPKIDVEFDVTVFKAF